MVKKIMIAIGLCLAVGAVVAYYLYTKPRPGVQNVTPAYSLKATELYALCTENEQQANQKYLNKVLQVTGTVDKVETTDTTMNLLLAGGDMGGINCSFVEKPATPLPAKGETIRIKGRYIGFLMDVNLVDAVIVEP